MLLVAPLPFLSITIVFVLLIIIAGRVVACVFPLLVAYTSVYWYRPHSVLFTIIVSIPCLFATVYFQLLYVLVAVVQEWGGVKVVR